MKQQPQAQELALQEAAAPASQADLSSPAPDRARRSFLRAAPLGALAVVTGTAGAAEVPAAAPPAAPDPQRKRGYHETDHIRRYYQTAAYW
ncbi:formate dehydrogenase [Massilia sp. H6]|uniref:formate dehydrogenase n=1 Tax=Massilia sp. H6 TaxID=2970464 RepID=UPI002168B551|nr:formate dehydrogenase [Massilia sp. H6]UVW27399.1 formate dehydrogenase [Massilia sp. H6]